MQDFDPTQFKTDYPKFSNLPDDYLNNVYENEAIVLGTKVIALFNNPVKAYYWSCVVLAHILTISSKSTVGRVAQAAQGDVSGTFAYIDTADSAWWNQTPYGAKCYNLFKIRGGAVYVC